MMSRGDARRVVGLVLVGVLSFLPRVSFGQSAISFAAPGHYDLSDSEPRGLASADFDLDGDLDLVCGSSVATEISVLAGSGSGTFANDDNFESGVPGSWGFAAGDFDSDGIPDFAVTFGGQNPPGTSYNTLVRIYLGNGDLTFTPHQDLTAGWFPIAVVARDFNHDGILDLAVANNVAYGVQVFLGLGGGSFGPASTIPGWSGSNGTDLEAADFNGDGHVDLVYTHYGGTALFLGNGTGGFAWAGSGAIPGGAQLTEAAAAGDIDGDGDTDLVTAQLYAATVRVHRNNGAGTFALLGTLSVGGYWTSDVRLADFDGDGALDVAALDFSSNAVVVFPGVGDGTFGAGSAFPTGSYPTGIEPRQLVVGDWNGDARPDLAASCRDAGDTPSIAVRTNTTPPARWILEGHALPGIGGLPLLRGAGPLTAGSTATLILTHAAPSALAILVVGATEANIPIIGGILVPSPDDLLGIATDAMGSATLPVVIPPGIPAGTIRWVQVGILDPAATQGIALSNALRAEFP